MRDRVFTAQKIVSLTGLSELHGISELANGGLRIGALTIPLAELAAHPVVQRRFRALAAAAGATAARSRNPYRKPDARGD